MPEEPPGRVQLFCKYAQFLSVVVYRREKRIKRGEIVGFLKDAEKTIDFRTDL